MPRFLTDVTAADEAVLEKRFDPAQTALDAASVALVDAARVLEQMHLRGAAREMSRLAYKYGSDSRPVFEASRRARLAEQRVTALRLEADRLRAPKVKADPRGVVIHGRVLDEKYVGHPKLDVAVLSAAGRAVARARTDESGYFTLGGKPIAGAIDDPAIRAAEAEGEAPKARKKASAAAAEERRTRLVVLSGKQELYSEDLDALEAGQIRYREIVLRPDR
jgi:hypothetical protein